MSGNAQEMIATHTINTKKKNLTNEQRQGVLHFLLERLNGKKLQLNAINDAAAKFDGSIDFKLQHISKEKLRRERRLPVSISCKPDAVSQARNVLGR